METLKSQLISDNDIRESKKQNAENSERRGTIMLYFLEIVIFFAYTALKGWDYALIVIFGIVVFNLILKIVKRMF
jgi:hypothetical protein